ncbi:putative alcochol-O-acetyl transferase crmB [Aspergillus thermomutatus]|uniref:Alcohol acetyltransferase n=1 Tax=Aspergillus thermomutatus TaxID=41047 RepID=A0A397H0P8_ASPTH|nr:uncharacterized protein CDV56_102240 [Aspergillus thermomutatus]RHZ54873.1 hypothetical protein CDV56_102240 [Aspergillus thermomutatus]
MADIHELDKLRPLGKLEQVSASCHHLGFFNNVGLSAHYRLSRSSSPAVSDLRGLIHAAAGDLVRQHPILFAIPVNEGTPNPHFASLPSIDLNRSITFLERRQPLAGAAEGEDKELDAILEDQHNTDFKSEYGTLPFWRLIILQSPGLGNEFTASFIYHHAIGDGVSGLALHNAFRNALDAASSSCLPDGKTENIIVSDANAPVLPPLEELHLLPLNPTPPPPATTNLKEWTGNSIHGPCKSHWASFYLSPSASKAFVQECKERNLSVTSTLSSVVATVLFGNLPSTVEALTCIIPVNLRPWLKLPHEVANVAIGSYFDATRARLTCPDQISRDLSLADVWSGAQQVSKSINDYLSNVSPSGEPYTSVAIFKTIPDVSLILNSMLGKPRDAAFEVTNVGVFSPAVAAKTEENASLWQVGKVLLSRSSAVTGAAVTVTVATGGDGIMALGFSWQEGVLEDGFVDIVKQGVRKYFEKYQ